jgi:prophage regulatory protein
MASEILRLPDVRKRTGLSRSSIYIKVSEGRFPRPIRIGDRAVGWISAEIEAWQSARVAERDQAVVVKARSSRGSAVQA